MEQCSSFVGIYSILADIVHETRNTSTNALHSQDVVLQLPDGVEVDDIRWISVYCRQYDIDFGHVKFSEVFEKSRKVFTNPNKF